MVREELRETEAVMGRCWTVGMDEEFGKFCREMEDYKKDLTGNAEVKVVPYYCKLRTHLMGITDWTWLAKPQVE